MEKTWSFFACPRSLLNLDIVLNCGQCFRWSKHETGEWVGVVGKRIWILKQDSEQIFYKSIGSTASDSSSTLVENGCQSKKAKRPRKGRATHFYVPEADVKDLKAENEEAVLKDYFQLKIDLEGLYEKWSMNDQVFNKLSQNFGGLRMLRQDPVENLFSFICSQNNHITRIASMVNKLCANYGQLINNVGGKPYYEFPTVSALSSDDVDGNLRKLGFGYRAKFINQCAKQVLKNGGNTWLYTLRETPYKEAHSGMTFIVSSVNWVLCLALEILQKIFAENFCRKFLQDIFAGNFCRAIAVKYKMHFLVLTTHMHKIFGWFILLQWPISW